MTWYYEHQLIRIVMEKIDWRFVFLEVEFINNILHSPVNLVYIKEFLSTYRS